MGLSGGEPAFALALARALKYHSGRLLVDAIGPQSLPYPPLGRSGWRTHGTAAMR